MKYFVLLFVFLAFGSPVFSYTLPYPSYMPGHKFYKISRYVDKVKALWYWGRLGQVKYHTALADKYLVEAKTLFEYKQYLLAVDALKRSNEQISITSSISQEQLQEHVNVLVELKQALPREFLWQPEKQQSTYLPIHRIIDEAMVLRNEKK